LFGSEPRSRFSLKHDFWGLESKVSEEENEELTKPFTIEELEVVVKGMRDGSAPGPDGFFGCLFQIFLG